MEYMPEIASSLDVYADEITTSSEISPIVRVDCQNQEIKHIINVLLYSVLNIDFNLFGWARSTCKYGDYFLYLDIDEELGITNVVPLPLESAKESRAQTRPTQITFNTFGAGDKTRLRELPSRTGRLHTLGSWGMNYIPRMERQY